MEGGCLLPLSPLSGRDALYFRLRLLLLWNGSCPASLACLPWGLLLGQLLGGVTTTVGKIGTNVMNTVLDSISLSIKKKKKNTVLDSVSICLVEYNISILAYFGLLF